MAYSNCAGLWFVAFAVIYLILQMAFKCIEPAWSDYALALHPAAVLFPIEDIAVFLLLLLIGFAEMHRWRLKSVFYGLYLTHTASTMIARWCYLVYIVAHFSNYSAYKTRTIVEVTFHAVGCFSAAISLKLALKNCRKNQTSNKTVKYRRWIGCALLVMGSIGSMLLSVMHYNNKVQEMCAKDMFIRQHPAAPYPVAFALPQVGYLAQVLLCFVCSSGILALIGARFEHRFQWFYHLSCVVCFCLAVIPLCVQYILLDSFYVKLQLHASVPLAGYMALEQVYLLCVKCMKTVFLAAMALGICSCYALLLLAWGLLVPIRPNRKYVYVSMNRLAESIIELDATGGGSSGITQLKALLNTTPPAQGWGRHFWQSIKSKSSSNSNKQLIDFEYAPADDHTAISLVL